MTFQKKRSFGPRIRLTAKQEERIIRQMQSACLTCFIENCDTGSVYVAIGLPEWETDINGDWFDTLDSGCGEDVAKIRLSGHDQGQRMDSTHNCVGTKRECLAVLKKWLAEICEQHGPMGRKILEEGPPATRRGQP